VLIAQQLIRRLDFVGGIRKKRAGRCRSKNGCRQSRSKGRGDRCRDEYGLIHPGALEDFQLSLADGIEAAGFANASFARCVKTPIASPREPMEPAQLR